MSENGVVEYPGRKEKDQRIQVTGQMRDGGVSGWGTR